MRDDGAEAGRRVGESADRPGKGAAGRKGPRPPEGRKRPGDKKLRVQYHLGEETVQRLGVHCSLVNRNESAVVEEILAGHLARFGRGREIWRDSSGRVESPLPDTGEDRQSETAA